MIDIEDGTQVSNIITRAGVSIRIDDLLLDNPELVVSHEEYLMMKWFEKNGYMMGIHFSLHPTTHKRLFSALTPARRGPDGQPVETGIQ